MCVDLTKGGWKQCKKTDDVCISQAKKGKVLLGENCHC